jgi:hypothetical protein
MLRLASCFILCVSTLYGQTKIPIENCQNRTPVVSQWYVQAVLDLLAPPEPPSSRPLISISITSTQQPKLVLRTNGKIYEMFRGSPAQDVYKSLDEIDKACRLPSDPAQAVKLYPIKWDRAVITTALFEQTHRAFMASLLKCTRDLQGDYTSLLRSGVSYISFHTPEYKIIYDNGSVHLEITSDETDAKNKQDNSMLAWVHMIEQMAKRELP